MVSISACHAEDPGSSPGGGVSFLQMHDALEAVMQVYANKLAAGLQTRRSLGQMSVRNSSLVADFANSVNLLKSCMSSLAESSQPVKIVADFEGAMIS